MLIYFIPLAIIILSLLVILAIVIKKLPNLAAIRIETIPSEKEGQVKNRIITERLARKFLKFRQLMGELTKPLINQMAKSANEIYQKILELEKKNLTPQPLKEIDVRQQVKEKLEQVKKFLDEKDLAAAETVCIEILQLDLKNLDAYQYLVGIYLEKKEYKKSRETLRYLIKLLVKIVNGREGDVEKHRLANCYADLGWVYQLENKNTYALNYYQKAIELEPNNPRFLDLLLKICIILKNKNLAQEIFLALSNADPENQKLAEIRSEIENLPDK